MAMQNLVSASLSQESKTRAQSLLAEVMAILDFLTTLRGDEVRSLFKAGNGYAPFLDRAFEALSQHPGIIPAVFPTEEFRKDYQLMKDLAPIASQIEQLAEGMQKTMIALASDTMAESLEIYRAVKANSAHVPGLAAVEAEMGTFFSRSRRAAGAATTRAGA